jgi:hypothetical protein
MVAALTLALVGAPNPTVGARLGVETVWTNTTAAPVRVPSDWASHLDVTATWQPAPGPHPATAFGGASSTALDAASVAWITVKPGERLSAQTDLSSILPDKCMPGCRSGSIEVTAGFEARNFTGLAADQVPLAGQAQLVVLVAPDLPTVAASGLATRVAPRVDGAALFADVTVKNGAGQPVWLPNTWGYTCTSEWLTNGEPGGGGTGVGFGGQAPWGAEATRTRVPKGKTHKFSLPCGDAPPAGAKGIGVNVTAAPLSKFWPVDPHPGEATFDGELSAR